MQGALGSVRVVHRISLRSTAVGNRSPWLWSGDVTHQTNPTTTTTVAAAAAHIHTSTTTCNFRKRGSGSRVFQARPTKPTTGKDDAQAQPHDARSKPRGGRVYPQYRWLAQEDAVEGETDLAGGDAGTQPKPTERTTSTSTTPTTGRRWGTGDRRGRPGGTFGGGRGRPAAGGNGGNGGNSDAESNIQDTRRKKDGGWSFLHNRALATDKVGATSRFIQVMNEQQQSPDTDHDDSLFSGTDSGDEERRAMFGNALDSQSESEDDSGAAAYSRLERGQQLLNYYKQHDDDLGAALRVSSNHNTFLSQNLTATVNHLVHFREAMIEKYMQNLFDAEDEALMEAYEAFHEKFEKRRKKRVFLKQLSRKRRAKRIEQRNGKPPQPLEDRAGPHYRPLRGGEFMTPTLLKELAGAPQQGHPLQQEIDKYAVGIALNPAWGAKDKTIWLRDCVAAIDHVHETVEEKKRLASAHVSDTETDTEEEDEFDNFDFEQDLQRRVQAADHANT